MGDLGVFEAMANAGKVSAAEEADKGFQLEKDIDRAIFRAKERFGAYLANSQSKSDFDERWAEVRPQAIKVIAEVTTPTPGVMRRVGRALLPSLPVPAPTKKNRPSSTKTAEAKFVETLKTAGVPVNNGSGAPWIADPIQREAMDRDITKAWSMDHTALLQKAAWSYDKGTKLWTSKDPMQKFACPGCGTEQEQLGFTHCAGCDRTWNSWPVRQHSSAKTGASTYMLMAREIKMRGDQFKMAAAGNVKIAESQLKLAKRIVDKSFSKDEMAKVADAPMPQESPPGMSQPNFGTMPGDNSGAMGAPVPPEQPATPGGDYNNDNDVAGGVTEDSPIDQIQDALQNAIMALKDVQMLSVNPALSAMASTSFKKVAKLRESMDRFWSLHKQMNYVAGMLAKEASEAIKAADPRITSEAEFVKGYKAAEANLPLPAKTGRAWLEGYVAFHKQSSDYSTGTDISRITESSGQDESNGARNSGSYLGDVGVDDGVADTSDAGPFDTSQPAQQEFARQIDQDNAQGGADRGQGQSGSIQPTSARRKLPKDRR